VKHEEEEEEVKVMLLNIQIMILMGWKTCSSPSLYRLAIC